MEIKNTIEKIKPVASCFLEKSMAVLDKTWNEILVIKKAWDICSFSFKLSYIAYLIYALAADVGILYVNIAFLVFSVSYLAFDTAARICKNAELKRKKGAIKRRFRIGKILIDTVKLSMAVYGVVVSWKNPSVISVTLAVFSALVFLFDIGFEIIYTIIMSRYALLREAFNQDVDKLKSAKDLVGAVATAGRFILKPRASTAIAGVGYASRYIASKIESRGEPQSSPDKKSAAVKQKLAKILMASRAERAEKKTLKKAAKRQAKLDKKASKLR